MENGLRATRPGWRLAVREKRKTRKQQRVKAEGRRQREELFERRRWGAARRMPCHCAFVRPANSIRHQNGLLAGLKRDAGKQGPRHGPRDYLSLMQQTMLTLLRRPCLVPGSRQCGRLGRSLSHRAQTSGHNPLRTVGTRTCVLGGAFRAKARADFS